MARKNGTAKVVLDITSMVLHLFLNLIFYIVVILLVLKASELAYQFAYQVFGSVSVAEAEGKSYTLTVGEGESTMNVAAKLEQNGIVVNRFSFYFRTKLMQRNIIPGEYTIDSSMDYDEILAVIAPELGAG